MALLSVVGGIGSAIGPVLGTYLVVPFGQVLRAELGSQLAGLHLVIYGFGLILVLYKLPNGIWPALERLLRACLYRDGRAPSGSLTLRHPRGGAPVTLHLHRLNVGRERIAAGGGRVAAVVFATRQETPAPPTP